MKTTLTFLSVLLLMGIFSCQTAHSPEESSQNKVPLKLQTDELNEVRIGEAFDLPFGKAVRIAGEELNLAFIDVLEDSRCPTGLTCVWAGNGELSLQLGGQGFVLNTFIEPKQEELLELRVELLALSPYPNYDIQTGKDEYVARLIVLKAEE